MGKQNIGDEESAFFAFLTTFQFRGWKSTLSPEVINGYVLVDLKHFFRLHFFRIVELTRLPREIIYGSERIQVIDHSTARPKLCLANGQKYVRINYLVCIGETGFGCLGCLEV